MEPGESEEQRELNRKLMEALRLYGERFLLFEKAGQPNVLEQGEQSVRCTVEGGELNPRALHDVASLEDVFRFLRERYPLFIGAGSETDCPEPASELCRNALEVYFSGRDMRFKCRKRRVCGEKECRFKHEHGGDIYDFVIQHGGAHDLAEARRMIGDYFGVRIGDFPAAGSPTNTHEAVEEDVELAEISPVVRHEVAKSELTRLFSIPMRGKGSGKRFVKEALRVIRESPLVSHDGGDSDTGEAIRFSSAFPWEQELPELGAASKLFIWVHWRQAEERAYLTPTVAAVAEALQVSERTVQSHKAHLVKRGLLNIDEKRNRWSAKYRLSD